MTKSPEQMFRPEPESDTSKRKTGREFMRKLFPGATKELDQAYERLDHLFRVIGGEITENNEGNGQDALQSKKYSFKYGGKIYQSDIFNAEQIKVFVTAEEFIDLVDMPDRGQAPSLDMQTSRVRLLIGKLENMLEEKRTADTKRAGKKHAGMGRIADLKK